MTIRLMAGLDKYLLRGEFFLKKYDIAEYNGIIFL